jgi:putative spermidine/putrescine transport system ATP-binding protein
VAELRCDQLTKRFGDALALDRLDLVIEDGKLTTLLGPSGSGKTTALRLVAGFLAPDGGSIVIDGRDVATLPPEKRDIGMVFQSYALFPHRNVFQNVAFGLERRRLAKDAIASRVARALAMVRLDGLEHRAPRELSGGQQQRVALARALVIEPTLLLLDEPLSNLDAALRGELRLEIRRIQRELGITTVLVTHDQEEALSVSDRIAVLHQGRLQQLGSPDELYHEPANRFVAEFVGKMNLLPATRAPSGAYRLDSGDEVRAASKDGPERALVAVRPEVVRVGAREAGNAGNALGATVVGRVFLGELTELRLALDNGAPLLARGSDLPPTKAGERVNVTWPVDATKLLEA